MADELATVNQPDVIIDYGCGQGLAGVLAREITEGRLFGLVGEVILIEPSRLALARSIALYKRIAPAAKVTGICKRFDNIGDDEIIYPVGQKVLHLFSNSLDIQGFNPVVLFRKALSIGQHTVLSVSHDRAFEGGTPQIESVKAALGSSTMVPPVTNLRSTLREFTCNNPSQSKGVVWLCEFEVHNG